MAWTSPRTYIAGEVHSAATLNTDHRDNLIALRGGGIAIPSQSALDFVYAATASQLGRLAAVAKKFPRLNSAGTAWEMAYPGAGVKDLYIPFGAFRPKLSGGSAIVSDELMSAGRYVQGGAFGASATESASLMFRFPKSWNRGTVTFQPYWFNLAGGVGAVVWSFGGVAASDSDSLDAALGTEQTSTDTALGAKVLAVGPESAAITIAGSPQIGDLCRLEVSRTPLAGGDTYGSPAYLAGVNLRLTTDNADDE